MYELNSTFSMTSREHFAADMTRARQHYAENGATDLLLGDIVTGMTAGCFSWSARFPNPDAVATYMRDAINAAMDPDNTYADVRARYQLVGRNLNQVINDVGERSGPHMILSIANTTRPVPVEENRHALETFVANGATGASTVLALDGDLTGRYLIAVYGNSFEEIEAASAAGRKDKRVSAAMIDTGTTPHNRIYLDIS